MNTADNQVRHAVIYDGDCAFCISQVRRIRKLDHRHQFDLIPSQTPGLLDRFPQLAGHDLDAALRVISPDGRVLVAADAIFEIARGP